MANCRLALRLALFLGVEAASAHMPPAQEGGACASPGECLSAGPSLMQVRAQRAASAVSAPCEVCSGCVFGNGVCYADVSEGYCRSWDTSVWCGSGGPPATTAAETTTRAAPPTPALPTTTPRSTAGPPSSTPGAGGFQPCIITGCFPASGGSGGCDIADEYASFPDPFAFFTNPQHPGVTLPGPNAKTKCGWEVGRNFVWNGQAEQCILNGMGYPLEPDARCSNGKYETSQPAFEELVRRWYEHSRSSARETPVSWTKTYVARFALDGEEIEAAMSMGHGVLGGLCGSCYLIRQDGRYVALLQTDVRAWSLELSEGAALWLAPDNYGGTCYIPDVRAIDCSVVLGA